MKATKQKPQKERESTKKEQEQEVRRTREEEKLSPHGNTGRGGTAN